MKNIVTELQQRLNLNRRQLAARLGVSTPYLGEISAGIIQNPKKFNAAVAALGLDAVNEGGAQ